MSELRLPRLQVGRQSAGFIRRGHPWLRQDRFLRGLASVQAGEAATLVDDSGQALGSALVEPAATICARLYHRSPNRPFDPAAALARAIAARAALAADPETDCYRLVHGEADHLPGLRVERYGSLLVVLQRTAALGPWRPAVIDGLRRHLPGCDILYRTQLDDLRIEAPTVEMLGDVLPLPDTCFTCRELGVKLLARPFDGLATGIYIDQRATRAWLRQRCRGARVLNLFAYTGAFSISLLQAGAASALDVDLSGQALALAAANASANACADRHQTRRADCLRFCRDTEEVFDLIICDPPTAARGGEGWVLRRDYPRLLAAAWQRLAPGGLLLAGCNTLGKPFDLRQALAQACAGADLLPEAELPRLGEDVPQLRGFPEGRPYRLVAARRPG